MIARVWAAIGRVPMYRIVLYALAVLVGASFVASAAGWLYYSPAELAALLGVVLVVTLGVSRLAARIWRAESHDESSLITALLLFFILKPGLETGILLRQRSGPPPRLCRSSLSRGVDGIFLTLPPLARSS